MEACQRAPVAQTVVPVRVPLTVTVVTWDSCPVQAGVPQAESTTGSDELMSGQRPALAHAQSCQLTLKLRFVTLVRA